MMARRLVVIGASGFGRETLDVVEAYNSVNAEGSFDIVGVLDDAPSSLNLERLAARRINHLGAITDWLCDAEPHWYLIGIGDSRIRRRLAERFDTAGHQPATVVHPAATLGSQVTLGDGVIVCSGTQISTNVRLGRHVHVNPNATVGHDTVCEDFVSLNPGSVLSGECRIREGALVGAGAVVLQGLEVGRDVVVGAAACVTRPVPEGSIVKGVPGRWGLSS